MLTIIQNRFLPTLLFLLSFQFNAASKVTITSIAPTYAGSNITFYSYYEHFAYTKNELTTVHVNDTGYFTTTIEINETQKIYSDLGIFKAFFFAEQGKTYELVLPQKVEKQMKDKVNPYFQPVEIHLGIKNAVKNDLNILIRMYNDSYIPYFNKHVINVTTEKDFSKLDDEINKFTNPFHEYNNTYLETYIRYKTGYLRFLATQNKSKKSSDDFFIDNSVNYTNSAYMELFNQVYEDYFVYLGRTDNGKVIYENINRDKSFETLSKTLSKDKALTDVAIRELVIIKNIHDEFYDNHFSRSALTTILDSLITKTNIEEHKVIATKVMRKITNLLAGHYPPDFELYDQDSNLIKLSDLKGQYVYINFCANHSYSCMQEYEALKYLFAKHNQRIKIITISTDLSFSSMVKSKKQLKIPWTFLHFENQPDILEKYDIRAFPTYFLIDKEGKLISSPAPSPGENIEKTLFDVMRANGDI